MHRSFKNKGFTLVELIVVIVILAILATIAFLSFSSQSASARDSTRLADISNLIKGLSVFNVNAGNYPKPDSSMRIATILSSGTTIGYQGYAGPAVLGITGFSANGGKDPLDGTYYTYTVNSSQSKFQLLGFLEDGTNTALSYLPSTINPHTSIFADPSSYNGRYVISKGDQLGILLNSGTSTPIQTNSTGADIITSTGGNYIEIVTSKITYSGTGPVLWEMYGRYNPSSVGTYPGCDTPNIRLSNGQIWSACNVGAKNAYYPPNVSIQACSGSTDCDSDIRSSLGSYFQWGRNDDVTASAATGILAATGTLSSGVGHNLFINNVAVNADWLASPNDNLWGGSGTTTTTGTYLGLGSPVAMQGPCAQGYHVPTIKEWCDAIININPNLSCNSTPQNDTSVTSTLKMPLAGARNYSAGTFGNQNAYGIYWSSSPNTYMGSNVKFNSTQLYSAPNGGNRAMAMSVRCIKN